MDIKIDNDVPIPPPKGMGITGTIGRLQVGQSFIWPNIKVRSSVTTAGNRWGYKLCTRAEPGGGFRVWRVR